LISGASFAAQPLNKVVAIVNDSVITQNELNAALQSVQAQYAQAHTPLPPAAKLRSDILDQLIAQKLQLQIVKRAGITISDAELKATINQIAKSNHLTLAQLKQKVASSGEKYSAFEKNIKQQLLLSRLQHQAVMQEVKVSDADVTAAMREIKQKMRAASQMQILDVLVPASEKNNISAIKNALMQNTPNSKISAQYPSISFNDMGWQNANTLPEIFAAALKNPSLNQVVGPVQAPNGLHLLKIIALRAGPTQAITRDQAKMYVMQQKSGPILKKWVDKLRASAYVKIMPS
jgi:peptidyl-prolyl cis-trans isomerase SurA